MMVLRMSGGSFSKSKEKLELVGVDGGWGKD